MMIGLLIGMLMFAVALVMYVFELRRNGRTLFQLKVTKRSLENTEKLFKAILQNIHAFVLFINKVISGIVGKGIELESIQVIMIAVRSSVICSFIILGMALFVFFKSFSKNIISMMKKE